MRASDWSRLASRYLREPPPCPYGPGPHVVARLGGEDQLVAVRAEVLREDRAEVALGAAVGRAVVVGQVEVRDAAVERPPQDGPLGLQGLVVAEVVPQPERDGRELEAAVATAAEQRAPASYRCGSAR